MGIHGHILFMPMSDQWHPKERKMFDVLGPHIKPLIHRLPLPDLLLAAYLIGMNHMIEATDKVKNENP